MIYFYLLPIVLEAIDFKAFGLQPEGIPISLGFLFFLFLGLKYFDVAIFKDKIFKSFLLIILGLFISSFFSETVVNDLSRTIALTVGVIASVFFAQRFSENKWMDKLFYFFATLNGYWVYYVQNLFFTGKVSSDFHFNSLNQNVETINSHTIGIAISTSTIFLFTYFFLDKRLFRNIIGVIILFASLYSLILIQSRSNVSFTLLVGSVVLLIKFYGRIKISQLIIAGSLFVLVFLLIPQIVSSFEGEDSAVSQRFDFNDDEYQESTTQLRRYVYVVFWEKLTTNFIGTGIVRPKLFVGLQDAQNLLMHNQYATYVVAGGWISLFGVLGWIVGLVRFFKIFFLNFAKLNLSHISLNFALLLYFITLFTVEQSGILFFILFGFLISQNFYFFRKKTI
jgi:hypothetical protein